MSMNGMVNSTIRERVTRELRDFRTYDGAGRAAAIEKLGDDAEPIIVAECAVKTIVGYLLMDLRRLNQDIDSLALERLIDRQAQAVGLVVTGNSFQGSPFPA